jgi:hypothetical protein
MDVSDQPYMSRQWIGGGVIFACLGFLAFVFLSLDVIEHNNNSLEGIPFASILIVLIATSTFTYIAVKYGRDEFFALNVGLSVLIVKRKRSTPSAVVASYPKQARAISPGKFHGTKDPFSVSTEDLQTTEHTTIFDTTRSIKMVTSFALLPSAGNGRKTRTCKDCYLNGITGAGT